MPEYKPARFRRMLAWFLDLGICLMLPARLVTVLPLSANVQILAAAVAMLIVIPITVLITRSAGRNEK